MSISVFGPQQAFCELITPAQTKLYGSDSAGIDEFGADVASQGETIVVGAPAEDDNGANSGAIYVLTDTSVADDWSTHTEVKIFPTDGTANDRFGQDVDIDGKSIVVGGIGQNSDVGFAYVFTDTSVGGDWSTWTQVRLLPVGLLADAEFGSAVAIEGDTIVVGAQRDFASRGTVFVFQDTSGLGDFSTTSQMELVPPSHTTRALYGASVAIDGDTIAAGGPEKSANGTNNGILHIFRDTSAGGDWSSTDHVSIIPADGTSDSRIELGRTIELEGRKIISGASEALFSVSDAPGSVYVFNDTSVGGDWSSYTEQRLLASDGQHRDYFGYAAKMSGIFLGVGAREDSDAGNDAGSAYLFADVSAEKSFSVLREMKILPAILTPTSDQYFGSAIAFLGDTMFVGKMGDSTVLFRIGGVAAVALDFPIVAVRQAMVTLESGVGTLDIGHALVGAANPTVVITVENRGHGELTTSNLQVPAGFSVTEGLSATIAADSSDTFTISLSTATKGYFSGAVTFDTNDSLVPSYTFDIFGQITMPDISVADGGADLIHTQSSVDLGATTLNGPVLTRTFTVTNTGLDTLNISGVTVPPYYTVTENLNASLAPGGSDDFSIEMSTADGGTLAGDIAIDSDDPDEDPFTFNVTGLVDGPELLVQWDNNGTWVDLVNGAGPIDLGSIVQDSGDLDVNFRAMNVGTLTLTTSNLAITGSWIITNTIWTSIGAGSSDVFSIQLSDVALGLYGSTLSFDSNDSNESPFSLSVVASVTVPPIVRIDQDAAAGGDGTTWALAFQTLNDAIAVHGDFAEYWVAEGFYVDPIQTDDEMKLYGGFDGSETARGQRDWDANITTIAGDLVARQVVRLEGTNVVVDGFTITNGFYPGGSPFESGAGIFSRFAIATVANCKIIGNDSAFGAGGGVGVEGGSLTIDNCIIAYNGAGSDGAGIFIIDLFGPSPTSTVTIIDSVILGNLAGDFGGGIYAEKCDLTLINTIVRGNTSNRSTASWGSAAGIAVRDSNVTITNSQITGNTSPPAYGGGLSFSGSSQSLTITNTIISDNNNVALYLRGSSNTVRLDNNLFFNNPEGDFRDDTVTADGATAINSLAFASGNLDGDPLLESPYVGTVTDHPAIVGFLPLVRRTILTDENAGFTPGELQGRFIHTLFDPVIDRVYFYIEDNTETTITVTGNMLIFMAAKGSTYEILDHRPSDLSPAIDAGLNTAPLIPSTDINGAGRIQNVIVDIGPIEHDPTIAPSVVSIKRAAPNPTHLSPLPFNIEFDQRVTGVETTDFVLDVSGITGAAILSVTGSGRIYRVEVDPGSANGTVSIDLIDDDTILDGDTLALGGAGASNGNFTAGEAFTSTSESEIRIIVSGKPVAATGDRIALGNAQQGAPALARTLTVTNLGSADLTISSLSPPPAFTVTDSLNATIAAAGGTDDMTFQLGTASPGAFEGPLTFTTNDTDEGSVSIEIQGAILEVQQMAATLDLHTEAAALTVYAADSRDYLTRAGSLVVGDINGDGIQDLIIGAMEADGPGNGRDRCGEVYAFFGSPTMGGVRDVAGTAGAVPDLIIYGADAYDYLATAGGLFVGDINGDGIDDLFVRSLGASSAVPGAGVLHIFYGGPSLSGTIDLATDTPDILISGSSLFIGVMTSRIEANAELADVNGDGMNDFIFGSSGTVNILYGSASLPAVIELGVSGPDVQIVNMKPGSPGLTVGDFNGDGFADIVATAPLADGSGAPDKNAGEVYMFLGSATLAAQIDVSAADLTILGATDLDELGKDDAVMAADINGDGLSDLIVGSPMSDGPGDSRPDCGEAYIIFGRASFPSTIDLERDEQDVIIYGASGSVSGLPTGANKDKITERGGIIVGDLNGDGVEDFVLGTSVAQGPDALRPAVGEAFVFFGRDSWPSRLDLRTRDEDVVVYGANGSSIVDGLTFNRSFFLSDLDGDGVHDLVLAAFSAAGPAEDRVWAGEVYVVLGASSFPDVIDFANVDQAVTIYGSTDINENGLAVYGDQLGSFGNLRTGDLNNDGLNDILAGAWVGDGPGDTRNNAGDLYAVFGDGPYTTGRVKRIDHAGNPLPKDYGTARAEIDFASGTGPSKTTVRITRNLGALTLPAGYDLMDVFWEITSDRTGFSADVTFKYLESEVAGISAANIVVSAAPTVAGPFTPLTTVDRSDINEASVTVSGFSVFVLGSVLPLPPEADLFVGVSPLPDGGGPIDFGAADYEGAAPSVTFTLENNGPGPLNTTDVVVPVGFVVTEGLNSTIGPSSSDDFTIAMDTFGATGVLAGQVDILLDDGDENPYSFSVTGLIRQAEADVFSGASPVPGGSSGFDFGLIELGAGSLVQVFRVENNGAMALSTSNLSVGAGYAITEGLDASIAAGGSDTFTVSFLAATEGTFPATISFDTNDPGEDPYSFEVTSTVVAPAAEVMFGSTPIADGLAGKCRAGNRVLIKADVVPELAWTEIKQVRFEYRPTGIDPWLPIPPANPPDVPNPDTTFPFYTHWDLTPLAEGDYDVRAVATDIADVVDPDPQFVTFTVDSNCGHREFLGAQGEGRLVAPILQAQDAELGAGDPNRQSLVKLLLPAGAASEDTETIVNFLNPDDYTSTLGSLTSIGFFFDLSLGNGQSAFDGAKRAILSSTYADTDDDGLVDGLGIEESRLSIYWFDGSEWLRLGDSQVLPDLNRCEATTDHFTPFAILAAPAGPPMPSVPVVSPWGLIALSLLLLGVGWVALPRFRR